jgi:hypothetical protein
MDTIAASGGEERSWTWLFKNGTLLLRFVPATSDG